MQKGCCVRLAIRGARSKSNWSPIAAALKLLRSDLSPHAKRIERIRSEHPNFALIACGQTVERLRDSGIEVRLLPGTRVASSALDQIVSRMSQGWNYVRI
jgi:intracellular sulfur oxidation DsrE/DsrF family protein